jgi:hypothetical protein
MKPFDLNRNAFGKLVFSAPGAAQTHVGVMPVRAFPIASPDSAIAIVDADGKELAWIACLGELPATERILIEEELAVHEFLPKILRLRTVSTFATPSIWKVETDRGVTTLQLRNEEDIRRIAHSTLVITDSNGVQFLIPDMATLDKASRKLLDRFL